MAIWAVVPAAGTGSRLNADVPKQYLELGDQTVLEHSLARLDALARLSATVVVLRPGDAHGERLCAQGEADGRLILCEGGADRYQSVLRGLVALKDRADVNDWVLVHDAARPCVRVSDILSLIDAVSTHSVGGLLAVPVSDTLKRADEDNQVLGTVDRSTLWTAQTPQMFRYGMLLKALEMAVEGGYLVTDEASALEHAGHQPLLVRGSNDNIKITWAQDIGLATLVLRHQTESQE